MSKLFIYLFIVFDLILIGWIVGRLSLPSNSVGTEAPVSPTVMPTFIPIPTLEPLSSDNLFQIVNNWRSQNGHQPYIESEFACNIASTRLPEVQKKWSHEGFDGKRFCTNECYLGENLATGYFFDNQISNLLNDWLNSPSHRENLEINYTHSCIKCNSGYCVQIFSYY